MGAENETDETMIPKARFDQVIAQRNEWKQKAETFESELTSVRELAGEAQTWKGRFEDLEQKFNSAQSEWGTERTFLEHGLTDGEGRAVAELFFNKLPEDERPELGDWLSQMKGDPTKAPKALAPYLPQAANGGGQAGASAGSEQAGAELPDTTRGVETGSRASEGGSLSAEKIREMRLEAQRTGDWSRYKELRPQILGEIQKR